MTVKPVRNDIDAARVSFASIIIAALRSFGARKISPTHARAEHQPPQRRVAEVEQLAERRALCKRSTFETT